jgi:hypothetical protein
MTLINPLFIVKTDIYYKSSIDLVNQILYNHGSVYIKLYQNKHLYDLYYKYLALIKGKSYIQFTDNIFYDTYHNIDINIDKTLYADDRLKKFSHFVYLDCNNIYCPSFFPYVSDLKDNIDLYIIKPYQTIDINLQTNTEPNVDIKIISKKLLEFLFVNPKSDINRLPKSFTSQELRNNYFVGAEHNNVKKHAIQESKFKLLYLIENPNSIIKNSYCFFYNENSKCMNIDNNIVGNFSVIDQNQIIVHWNHNGSIYAHTYVVAENNNYYRAIKCDQKV